MAQNSKLKTDSAELRTLLGYHIMPTGECPNELCDVINLKENETILTVGGAITPFYFLKVAQRVNVIEIRPKQVEHMEKVKVALQDNHSSTFIRDLLDLIEPYNFRDYQSFETEMWNYYDLLNGERARDLREKLTDLSIKEGNILNMGYEDSPADVLYVSTIPWLFNQVQDTNAMDRLVNLFVDYINYEAKVCYATFEGQLGDMIGDIKDRVYGELNIQEIPSNKYQGTTYYVLSLNQESQIISYLADQTKNSL